MPLVADGGVVMMRPYKCTPKAERGDLAIFRSAAHKSPIIKQIRGIGGDRFSVQNGRIILNDNVLLNARGQPYVLSNGRSQMIALYERDFGGVIPRDSYLVLSTMTGGGLDSTRLGLISHRDMIGIAYLPGSSPHATAVNP